MIKVESKKEKIIKHTNQQLVCSDLSGAIENLCSRWSSALTLPNSALMWHLWTFSPLQDTTCLLALLLGDYMYMWRKQ